MEVELGNIGQTFAVGAFAAFGLLHLYSIFRSSKSESAMSVLDGREFTKTVFFAAFTLVSGLILESFSKGLVTDQDFLLSQFYDSVLMTDKTIRLRSMFEVEAKAKEYAILRPRPITRQIMSIDFNNDLFEAYKSHLCKLIPAKIPGPNSSAPAEIFLTWNKYQGLEKKLKEEVNNLYYIAKNRIYKEAEYHKDLEHFDFRSQGIRTFAITAFSLLILYATAIIYWIANLTAHRLSWWCLRERWRKSDDANERLRAECYDYFKEQRLWLFSQHILKVTSKEFRSLFYSVLAFAALFWLCKESHKFEENARNQRIFGYYISLSAE